MCRLDYYWTAGLATAVLCVWCLARWRCVVLIIPPPPLLLADVVVMRVLALILPVYAGWGW